MVLDSMSPWYKAFPAGTGESPGLNESLGRKAADDMRKIDFQPSPGQTLSGGKCCSQQRDVAAHVQAEPMTESFNLLQPSQESPRIYCILVILGGGTWT